MRIGINNLVSQMKLKSFVSKIILLEIFPRELRRLFPPKLMKFFPTKLTICVPKSVKAKLLHLTNHFNILSKKN